MKTKLTLIMGLTLAVIMLSGCEKDEVKVDKSVTLGAQLNATVPGFYAVGENKTYTIAQAAADQGKIDLLCFFETVKDNNTCIASPGSGIKAIFTTDDKPDNWIIQNLTRFCQTTLTVAQFNAVQNGDMLIETSYDSENSNKKAKDVKVDDVWSFLTADNIHGLILVTDVKQGDNGYVTFKLKTK